RSAIEEIAASNCHPEVLRRVPLSPRGTPRGLRRFLGVPRNDSSGEPVSAQHQPIGRHTLRDQRSELPERRLDGRLFLAVANLRTHAALFAPLLSPTLSRSLRAQGNLRV